MNTRWSSVDPLVFLVGGIALLTYALHGFSGMLSGIWPSTAPPEPLSD